ncbi:hypothetical protein F4780DRAFT_779858 [Xylariomycetidae sp. FL0641]|nr:hypothetical protein F4780DRAFT_779858 [Xylariomycetidae sp. FL0641]
MAPKPLALVTGANGFIGARTVGAFLDAGWAVRAAVRDPGSPSAAALSAHLSAAVAAGDLSFATVPDMTVAHAFDAAAAGAAAVAHLASPLELGGAAPASAVVGAAARGTRAVVGAALAAQDTVRAVVFMSSVAAIRSTPVRAYSEDDWNEEAARAVTGKRDDEVEGRFVYPGSKTVAEKAFWRFVDEEKPRWRAVAVNPAWVLGPPLSPPASPAAIAQTALPVWRLLTGSWSPPPVAHGTTVDVRDVARVVVVACAGAGAGGSALAGRRCIVGSNGNAGNAQAIADVLRRAYPDRRAVIPEGRPGEGYRPDYGYTPDHVRYLSDRAIQATGQEWIPYERIILDTAKAFEHLL